ncbi:MAG: transglycosylase domain-containing protein [Halofilum sp. (in: g-proteobacteria)]|nr:transglycosylase domain-containing protein [Halofilum sp. (in: g-proteobacteria)]
MRFAGAGIAAVDAAGGGAALARIEPERIGRVYAGRRADRVLVRLEDVPPELPRALIAVEDRDFRSHHGVQPLAIARAALANLRAGRTVQGGSTLTQQLVKNFFLSNERTLRRKFTEALMALSLELHYSKEQILEAYINEVYLGQDGDRAIHGFGLGARFWFDRPLEELRLHELALLGRPGEGAVLLRPARASRNVPARAATRRCACSRAPARSRPRASRPRCAGRWAWSRAPRWRCTAYPAYLDLVRRQLAEQYPAEALRGGGLRVYTHLEPGVQAAAEQALATRLARLDGDDVLQGAVVVADSDSGALQALVGDRAARRSGYNRALDARRPVGSLVKPAVYVTALARPERYTLVTPLRDEPLRVELDGGRSWSPRNYDGRFHGRVPLIEALVHSYNVASARLGLDLGLGQVAATLERLRLPGAAGLVPADLLGALSLTPLEVTRMYQTLAAGGFDAPLRTIAAVHAADGTTLDRSGLEVRPVLDPGPVFLLDTALARVAHRRYGRALASLLPGGRSRARRARPMTCAIPGSPASTAGASPSSGSAATTTGRPA